ncbi:MAG TPA: hypothetical protein VGD11_06565 [Mycobacteriales bacterium]|jgi:hypothetical protein
MSGKQWAAALAIVAVATVGAAAPAAADQHGYDTVVCHTDTAYIYQDADTSSTRLDALPRGAHFQVYHDGGTFTFGVRNYNGVSGHVLASQLCRAQSWQHRGGST